MHDRQMPLASLLMATAALVMLITAVARLNALNAGTKSTAAHGVLAVEGDPLRVFEQTDDVTSANGAVHALFNLDDPNTGPFPSDVFTVADSTHNTGRRVNLPYPDCSVRVSDCGDLDVINTLDGGGGH